MCDAIYLDLLISTWSVEPFSKINVWKTGWRSGNTEGQETKGNKGHTNRSCDCLFIDIHDIEGQVLHADQTMVTTVMYTPN